MLFVIAMMIEDDDSGSMTLVQDTFVGVTEDEALGKALRMFKGYGSVHSYKISLIDKDVSEKNIYDLEGVDTQIVEFLHRGHKIQAIKRYRELSGYGLKQSKEFIDKLIAKHDNLLRTGYINPDLL